jgi:peptidoglycan hydrolase CwlO-like protein
MKELFIDIISKIIYNGKVFITKVKNDIRFEGRKSGVISVMYSPIFEKKNREKDMLLSELSNVKKEIEKLDKKIVMIKEEISFYNKKVDGLNSFQRFMLENHY